MEDSSINKYNQQTRGNWGPKMVSHKKKTTIYFQVPVKRKRKVFEPIVYEVCYI